MKILKKGGGSREKGEEETKSMPHAPVDILRIINLTIDLIYKTYNENL
jgi:hypothetical protein